ncbi:MAG: response regulator [Clostridia bacterium]|nr:response regulator [Clostridia bacterium]
MKRNAIILCNVIIMAVILVFVFLYVHQQNQDYVRVQMDSFENMANAMEQVTANYLQGEQRICDVWAHYIESAHMTMDEAVAFVRVSHVHAETSAHFIYVDDGSMEGLSTRSSFTREGDYAVSYAELRDLFPDFDAISEVGKGFNITRAYTNPMTGRQAIAFYNKIHLHDPDTDADRMALLLRIVPLFELENSWVFPKDRYQTAEFAIIDASGSYIIRGDSFADTTTFFDFYKAYSSTGEADQQQMELAVTEGRGTIRVKDARGEDCLVAHIPIASVKGWNLLSCIQLSELQSGHVDWLLIGIVTFGLLLLFAIDFTYMAHINRQLKEMAKEADSANRAKTDFLSTMSHDIRTPMNAIIGLTTIAEKNVTDPVSVGENLRKISLASNHLLTLINDILDISKVESGKLNMSPVSFSIARAAENLVNMSQPMVKEKNIDFSFRINGIETEYLYADQLRLNQIFINILSNAIKYTEPGGKVTVDMREDKGEKPGTVQLTYRVADTGIGMSKEFMEKMYQPFSRQTDSRVNTIQGTGLGLAITRQMVQLMGGTIDCESEPGVGTTFTVRLNIPIADRQLEEMHLDPVDVLIADDDEVLLETAKDTLNSIGATAETAASGDEALRMICKRHELGKDFGVVILDWKMPGMDGIEVVRRIRGEMKIDVPILLISAYDWSDIEDMAREAGANGFISKPLFRSTLYEKLSELLGLQAEQVEPEEDDRDIAGMHILVAEDNDINWEIISMLLQMHGVESERAVNGQLAVHMLSEAPAGQYDLVFMDIQMPVMNGLDATRAIRALPNWAGKIPIIAMTADAFSENVAECFAAGMNGHIAKPVDINLVLKEIRRIRESRR